VEVHIRFGKEIFSPLVPAQKADLIMALEMQEALRGAYFANEKTKFLLNQHIIPIPLTKALTAEEILSALKKIVKEDKSSSSPKRASAKLKEEDEVLFASTEARVVKDVYFIQASEICQKAVSTDVAAGIYLLGAAVFKEILPLNEDVVIAAIKKIIPEKYLELNLKSFNLAKG